jgi:DNA-binding CsgD family transcriptional regulator
MQSSDSAVAELVSPREREVVRLAVFGRGNAEIACALGIREATVKRHLNNVFHKLGIRRRRELVGFTFLLGII